MSQESQYFPKFVPNPHNDSVDFPLIKTTIHFSIPKPSLRSVLFLLTVVSRNHRLMKYYSLSGILLSSFVELNPLYIWVLSLSPRLTSFVVTFPFLWFVLLLHFLFLCLNCNPCIFWGNCKWVLDGFNPSTRTSSGRARAVVRSSYPLKPRWTWGLHCSWALYACNRGARWGCCEFIRRW